MQGRGEAQHNAWGWQTSKCSPPTPHGDVRGPYMLPVMFSILLIIQSSTSLVPSPFSLNPYPLLSQSSFHVTVLLSSHWENRVVGREPSSHAFAITAPPCLCLCPHLLPSLLLGRPHYDLSSAPQLEHLIPSLLAYPDVAPAILPFPSCHHSSLPSRSFSSVYGNGGLTADSLFLMDSSFDLTC